MDTGFDPAWIENLDPVQVYKHDARSRVWRIDAPDGRVFVIKRFEFNPLKQRVAALLGVHPGQRERRSCDRLYNAWVPVVPIVASGKTRAGSGVKLWLATPYMGKSLHNLIYHGELSDADRRERVLDSVGMLTNELIRKVWFNRDHKASNIVIDDQDRAWLIDVGAVRRLWVQSNATRMLTNLSETLTQAGATPGDVARLLKASSTGPASNSEA